MLASITPLGERGRNATWGITVAAFILGATAAGAALGAALAALGSLIVPASAGTRSRLIVLALGAGVAIVLDAVPRAVPGPRRQVNERWLDEYRGWVYGLGFGAQLGLAVTTIVSSAATYVALLAALLAPSVAGGALIVGCFGVSRGLTVVPGAWIRTPRHLLGMHRVLECWRQRVRWGGLGLLAVVALAAAGAAGAW
jgi:hypothetical protein